MNYPKLLFTILLGLSYGIASAQNNLNAPAGPLPSIVEKNGRYALLVDGKPFFMLGGQVHNSSAWPGMMPHVWDAVKEMHLNTLEIPLYWEQVEPEPGKFDFSLIDTLLAQAREHRVHLVFLWFATWKNGSNHYMPEWMKRDAVKFPNITGKQGQPIDSPSPLSQETLDADKKAFTAVMRYLKKADELHTVIMVQVENESGAWGSVRDYSAAAQKLFEAPVPAGLLKPSLLQALHVPIVSSGSWQTVFGDRADEYFHAWWVARFVGEVAAAGKREYPLPMYTNAALRDPLTNPPATNYESGGPTDNVLPIWKAAAPAIDLLAPDIYLPGTDRALKVLDLYSRPGNPLFVPEIALIPENSKYLYEVIARGGIGFSPFGIDDVRQGRPDKSADATERLAPYAEAYSSLSPLMRQIAEWAVDGKISAAVEPDDHSQQIVDLGQWKAMVSFGSLRGNKTPANKIPWGRALIVRLGDDKFLVIGAGCHLSFQPSGNDSARAWQYLRVEEGHYENGRFKAVRILNGDETDWCGPYFGEMPMMLQVTVVRR